LQDRKKKHPKEKAGEAMITQASFLIKHKTNGQKTSHSENKEKKAKGGWGLQDGDEKMQ